MDIVIHSHCGFCDCYKWLW